MGTSDGKFRSDIVAESFPKTFPRFQEEMAAVSLYQSRKYFEIVSSFSIQFAILSRFENDPSRFQDRWYNRTVSAVKYLCRREHATALSSY